MNYFKSLPLVYRQFIKFSIIGFGHFLLDASVFGLQRFFGVFPELAKAVSFIITASSSYYFNRRWTFRSTDQRIGVQYGKFLVVAMVGLVVNTGSFSLFLRVFSFPEIFSFAGAAGVAMFWNFFANRLWTFKK